LEDHQVIRLFSDNQALRERLQATSLPQREFFKVQVEGFDFDGWCLKPSDFDPAKSYPLLVHVYGEPHGQTVRDAWGGSRALWHWMLAEQGYVVISIDNRGTIIPKGRDWRKSVHRQIGTLASADQAAAIKNLLSTWDFIDKNRIGVWGWSGGGSMSLNAVFRYPELYRTAVAVAPVPDQRLYDTIYQERYMGLPDDNEEGYRLGSPLTHAKNLRGNLLIIHGTGDDNCHYQGVELLMDELIRNNKYFSVLPYPNRSHSINEGDNTVPHFFAYITKYLEEHLLNAN
jgi:dipeptidyl-peptidase-4